MEKINRHIQKIYQIARELEADIGRRFTPDGHMVGSIGEVLAAYHYGLRLLPQSTEGHDAETKDDMRVQIKTTHGKRIALSSSPDRLLVLKLAETGEFEEVFNGPGDLAWKAAGKKQKNGQRAIYLSTLKKIMLGVDASERLERLSPNGRKK